MALGMLAILGLIIGLIGTAMGQGWIMGLGVLLFFGGFLIIGASFTLPWYVWGIIILLIVYVITRKK